MQILIIQNFDLLQSLIWNESKLADTLLPTDKQLSALVKFVFAFRITIYLHTFGFLTDFIIISVGNENVLLVSFHFY